MTTNLNIAEYAVRTALTELQSGRKQAARFLAQRAIMLAPDFEDGWLILAAVSGPRASLEYCQRALEINPQSPRALAGLEDARRRIQAESGQASLPLEAPGRTRAIEGKTQPRTVVSQKVQAHHQTQLHYKRRWGLYLIAPWLIGLVIFKLAPILATLGISFTDFNLINPDHLDFVGFQNYISLFRDPNLWTAFLGTFRLALIVIPIQVIAAILLATLLSNEKLVFKNTLRMLFFLPSIIPSVAAMFMWQGFVNPRSGWLNPLLLNPLGLAKYVHFSTRGATPSLMILATFWSIGPGFLIIMGAMQGIPPDIYEAAQVDGAGRLRRFFAITLPLVSPAIFFTLILNLTSIFGGAILLDRGNTFNSSLSSVDSYLYYILFDTFHLGSAASLAWIFFIFMLVVVLILFATSKRWVYFPDQEK
ncbi:MAG TPA: sugar ABC transporter permease [Anaerolineales bacterium]|nr:sugar ABC transporter permease [Anaerolineales bacterium]